MDRPASIADRLARALGKLKAARAQLPYLGRGFALVWGAAPRWTAAGLACLVAQGFLPIATVYLTRALVDAVVAARHTGGSQAAIALLRPGIALVAVLGATELLRAVSRWLRTGQAELVRDHISGLVHERASTLDLAFFETPEYHDLLHRVRADAHTRPAALLDSAGGVLQNAITLVAMAAVLAPYGLWLPAALLVSTLPAFYVVVTHTVRQYEWRVRHAPTERRAWYYDWLLTARDAAGEMRLFNSAGEFRARYRDLRGVLRAEQLRLAREQGRAESIAGVAALAASGAVVGWAGWGALRGSATLGDVALFYQAFSQGQGLMRTLLGNVGQIYANSLFLGDLFDFLALQPTIGDPTDRPAPSTPLRRSIDFRAVSFVYPGSERAALHDFTMTIPAGSIVALVGPNGAGKSTLVRLLCRLYDPSSGAVEFDGVDIRRFPLAELRRRITVLFQEPVHYSETAARNIAVGDLDAEPSMDRIEAAAQAAGADGPIARLPHSYATMLGRWFGGAELSAGEWQRLALARAFLRPAEILVLDEPTSAMDSWAEADWLARFGRLASGRTAIVVTHRFTTAMRADVIHVIDGGRVVESGSHAELIARGGRYAQSWAVQMAGSAPR